ncbi:MAG: RNA polymerase sigma factor [Omnitrophica WOR_2 bacterium]
MNGFQGNIEELLKYYPVSDPRVLEAIVLAYRVPIYRLSLSILNNPDEAEDAVQETLIQAATHLSQYRAGSNFKAWLFTIAVNTCRIILRRKASRERLNRLMFSLQSLVSHAPDPESAIVQQEIGDRLTGLVSRLPEKQRLVIILHMVHDLSIPEVAEILHTNPKTIYSRLYQAFRSLRRRLAVESELVENQGSL